MKPMKVAEDILPIGQFKSRAAEVLGRLRRDHRPIVITRNGRPAAVLIAPDEFDRLQQHQMFMEAVREGLAEAERGEVMDDEVLAGELDAEFRRLGSP
jgi:prevent-host-death family protein